jgi:NTP pyrophosphatase (non-canonical NTP hydrolase)
MKFKEYQELASRTANDDNEKNYKLANYAMGLSGEAGEVTDYLKKVVFHGHELDTEKLKDELGDVLWYLSNLANIVDIDLHEVAIHNIEKLKKRYPDGFCKERSQKRNEV